MKTRMIMIFPEFESTDVINDIRKKYGTLADLQKWRYIGFLGSKLSDRGDDLCY